MNRPAALRIAESGNGAVALRLIAAGERVDVAGLLDYRYAPSAEASERAASFPSDAAIATFAVQICTDASLWHTDLSSLDGFAPLVGEHLTHVVRGGIVAALDIHLSELASIPS